MKKQIATLLIAMSAALTGAALPTEAKVQSGASALSTLSALPLASVVVASSAAAGSVVAVPLVLSTAGAVLVVKTVEVSARGTVYVLERASDGAIASIEIVGKGVGAASLAVGTAVTVSVIGAGVILSAVGQVIAFIPNELGRALLHNERLTN